jgi:hypothetical protein
MSPPLPPWLSVVVWGIALKPPYHMRFPGTLVTPYTTGRTTPYADDWNLIASILVSEVEMVVLPPMSVDLPIDYVSTFEGFLRSARQDYTTTDVRVDQESVIHYDGTVAVAPPKLEQGYVTRLWVCDACGVFQQPLSVDFLAAVQVPVRRVEAGVHVG